MREILFRGISKVTDKWIYGDLFQEKDEFMIWVLKNDERWNYPLYPETIGQYIGLNDNNSQRIFEGDIVRIHDTMSCIDDKYRDFTGVVEYRDNAFVIVSDPFIHYSWIDYDIEVIGNIHDNPKLLKTEE